MIISSTAKKYAKALFEIAVEKNCLEKVIADYQAFLNILEADEELKLLIKMPNVNQREKTLLNLFQQRFSEIFIRFLLVVLRNRRYYLLHEIFDDLQTRYDLANNRLRAEAITAFPLTKKKIAELSKRMSSHFKAEVRIDNKVDSSILGGIIIKLNGQVFNASLIEQFNRLKQYVIKN